MFYGVCDGGELFKDFFGFVFGNRSEGNNATSNHAVGPTFEQFTYKIKKGRETGNH
jgi:hypothetical protein